MKIKVEARQKIIAFWTFFSEFSSFKFLPTLGGLEFKHVI